MPDLLVSAGLNEAVRVILCALEDAAGGARSHRLAVPSMVKEGIGRLLVKASTTV